MHTRDSTSCFSPPPSVRDPSSRSSSFTGDIEPVNVQAEPTAVPQARQDNTIEDAEHKSKADLTACSEIERLPTSTESVESKSSSLWAPQEDIATATANDVPSHSVSTGSGRRKDRMAQPSKLSDLARAAKIDKPTEQAARAAREPGFLENWFGGSKDEVDGKPWNILGWLVRGVESKLQK